MTYRSKPRVWLFAPALVAAACSNAGNASIATGVTPATNAASSASTLLVTTTAAQDTAAPSGTAPPIATSTAAPTTTFASPATTAPTLPPPMIYRWSTPAPLAIDLQYSGGSPPSLILASDGGSVIESRFPGIPAGAVSATGWSWADAGAMGVSTSAQLDVDGTPIVVESLHSGFMATVAVTTTGELVAISPFGPSAPTLTAVSHPGRVTDVAMRLGAAAPTGGPRQVLELWAAGYDQEGGQDVPTVWQTTGLDALDGAISGEPSTAVVVTGSAGARGPVLVGVDDANRAPASGTPRVFALLPEVDGSSRLWIAQDPDHGAPGPTELRFRDPTALEVVDDALWIGDANGLHRVGLREPILASTTLWSAPIRVIRLRSEVNTNSFEVTVLDADGQVIRTAGESPELIWKDSAATDFTIAFGQLVILHGAENEIVVLDPTVLS